MTNFLISHNNIRSNKSKIIIIINHQMGRIHFAKKDRNNKPTLTWSGQLQRCQQSCQGVDFEDYEGN